MLAVITGASRGFGRASARALAERGGVKEMVRPSVGEEGADVRTAGAGLTGYPCSRRARQVLLSRSGAFDDTMQEVHNVDVRAAARAAGARR